MTTKADELKLDIQEVNNLIQRAHTQRTKDVLSLAVRGLQTELAKLNEENKIGSTKPACTVTNATKCYEVKMNNYGWDQTDATVKLYVTLKDVHTLPKEAVICNFTEKSLDLHVRGLENKNYSLTINNLCEEINVNESSTKVKTDMIVISLAKNVPKQWSHVTRVEKRIKESKTSSLVPDVSEDSDPGASLMNLMMKMYQEGDDDMKKAIAKAWTTQQKNTAGLPDFP